jgi:phospholipase C
MVISPWSRGGWVCSELFDHTSVLLFLEKRFGVREENISPWRRAICGDLTSTLDFKTPNQDASGLALPSTADFLERVEKSIHSPVLRVPLKQAPTAQEGPQRLARALPYELQANGRTTDGKFWIELSNTGNAGAAFQVYDNTDGSGPWRYTIESGKRHSTSQWHDTGALEKYDLSLHGPNGFFRQFRGGTNNGDAEARVDYDAVNGKLVLTLANHGSAPLVFETAQEEIYPVAANEARKRTFTIAPGATQSDTWDLAASDHWYDIAVTVPEDFSFLRRFAGHLETSRPSKTDPAIGPMRV